MKNIVEAQRDFWNTGKTKSIAFRKDMLKRLRSAILKNEQAIYQALYQDLHKSETESYLTEVQIVLQEIDCAIKHVHNWQKPKRVGTPLSHFPSSSYIYREPFGNVLILSPWNYPFQLALAPLVGAIAGGNCVVIKASKSSPHVSLLIEKMMEEVFPRNYICCISDEYSYEDILEQKYDLIFFTGSERVGKIVMEAASHHVTPVVLELGGKSPCIVDKSADVALAARRLSWGKYLNAGQTCVAPDYVLIEQSIKEQFLSELAKQIEVMYGDALRNEQYTHIISKHHFDRLTALIEAEDKKLGGAYDSDTLCIAPTVFTNASFADAVMQEEIFGPILPVISYTNLEDVVANLKNRPRPLAFYLFCNDVQRTESLIEQLSFGGGCINDVIMHLANHHLPFGGVGSSGMGNYHGKFSFDTFTRPKSVLKGKSILDIPLRYPPYTKKKLDLVKKIL